MFSDMTVVSDGVYVSLRNTVERFVPSNGVAVDFTEHNLLARCQPCLMGEVTMIGHYKITDQVAFKAGSAKELPLLSFSRPRLNGYY